LRSDAQRAENLFDETKKIILDKKKKKKLKQKSVIATSKFSSFLAARND
jgi:hypothetical protein